MTTDPKKMTTKLWGGLELRWPSVVVFAVAMAALVAVWVTSSGEERLQILAALVPAIVLIQAFTRRIVGAQPPASDTDGPATTPGRRTRSGSFTALPRILLPLSFVMLTGCGAGTMATLTTVAAAAKPVGLALCWAARQTENVCERHGAYGPATGDGPIASSQPTSGAEVEAVPAPTVAVAVETP